MVNVVEGRVLSRKRQTRCDFASEKEGAAVLARGIGAVFWPFAREDASRTLTRGGSLNGRWSGLQCAAVEALGDETLQ
jgi:hypothetical protein